LGKYSFHHLAIATGVLVAVSLTTSASALDVPFTENFDTGSSDWYNAAGDAPVGWASTGGPQGAGDAYATTSYDFSNAFEGQFLTLFRGQDEFMSSDDAFFGNWLTGGVTEFSFWFRHHAQVPLNAISRFSGPANTPAVSGLDFTPVMPDTWTLITFDIDPSNPSLFPEGGPGTFDAAFANIGHVQLGLQVPAGLEGAGEFTFDIDAISIVPTPAAWTVFLLAGLGRRRRR
jgi:hypothetical protein